ncbi:toll/interleukin-1 receptor domain-containing protein [Kribbella sp. NPDC049174]|uniref:toll/interleukin-1 receptor domain-containing protein n=1 Tax=Kribbella sp. NPDC049174 TaxID=3364112 RepID=UPI0037211641
MLYDVFICHASEDKDDFVRPLAERLRAEHVEVWYDEFSLKVGDSLRRSIDRGLSQSRFGVVVLSPTFFGKRWPQRELDGLVAREMAGADPVILPIWRRVEPSDVLAYSPPLADTLAISAASGLDHVVRQLVTRIRPQGSTLIIARDHLLEMGFVPPVISDDWWLDVAAFSESNDMEGGWQESMGWGRWGFPLPPPSKDPAERGLRMAWAALQMTWEREAESRPITQVTKPEVVAEFINSQVGLRETCRRFPRYLISYAPQLVIPGFGGEFEDDIETAYCRSRAAAEESIARGSVSGTALTTDGLPPRCADEYVLRDPEFGGYSPGHVACGFVQGNYVANGPPVMYYSHIDYVAWLLSDESRWLPARIRDMLTRGMAEWGVWIWDTRDRRAQEQFGFEMIECSGSFGKSLAEATSQLDFRPTRNVRVDLEHRLHFSSQLLGLPESGEELAARVLDARFLDHYFAANCDGGP